ncbi:MAG: hypothetical protein C0404_07725 [Verrucomicrobia bacterium]|nr:hypothetical protein [Verrucomicrobiota bacterium]
MRSFLARCLVAGCFLGAALECVAFDPASLPQVGCHPDGISYWGSAMFANGMYQADGWSEYSNGWGTAIAHWNVPQFDSNGFPRYLNPGMNLRCIVYGLNNPANAGLVQGQFILTWQGDADVRFGGTFIPGKSNCAATGRALNGRRAYLLTSFGATTLTVLDINTNNPITSIALWLPDPADPNNSSLEGQLWHPLFLQRIRDTNWGLLRMMNLEDTNTNPQRDWSDRRPPTHAFMCGVLNPRSPATGYSGNRGSGMAYEQMVDLCNTTSNDLWVCIPHLATDQFVTNLAQLIRYGSDGILPYTNTVTTPVHPPLSTNLRVYIEYSNEIWSWGDSFAQGQWAYDEAVKLGISKEQFNARRFCQVWRTFQSVFGGTNRLVRVAAIFTANQSYTGPFLSEMKTYGAGLAPAVEPDVIAATTYFGNGIQDWVHQKAQMQAGTSDPWFYTGATFGSPARPVSLAAGDPYWTGQALERHIQEAFREWTRRLLAGDAREGGGPDAVGIGGGFDQWLRDLAATNFASAKPIVAYEGGPSIYTDYMDGGDVRDDGITSFMVAMNRRAPIRDVYVMHLNMAKSKGLWMHMPFTLCSAWGKYGQWGHLEYSSQLPTNSPKYQFMLDWRAEASGLRHIDRPAGVVPVFDTAHTLPVAIARSAYSTDITVSGGNGGRTVTVIGKDLAAGLTVEQPAGEPDRIRVAGYPSETGSSYLYLRVTDADGDSSWRTFSLQTVGGPGTVVETDFRGTNLAQHLPWTNAYVIAPKVTYSGWNRGAGTIAQAGDNAIVYSVNAPADETNSTLALAIAENEYMGFTIQASAGHILDLAGAQCRLGIRRIDYHAPRRYAVFTSAGGFTAGAEIFTSDHDGGTDDQTLAFNLPNTAAYRMLSGAVEFRVYGFSGQYGGHRTSLIDFKLTAATPYCVRPASADVDGDGLADSWEMTNFSSTNAVTGGAGYDADGDGMSNLAEYLAGTNPTNATSALKLSSAGLLSNDVFRIAWPSVSGAVYRIDGRATLTGSVPWCMLSGGLTATPPANAYTVQPQAAQGFYRIVLEATP